MMVRLIPLTPACKRAIDETVAALKDQGHEVVDLTKPTIPSTSTTAIPPPPEVIPSIQRGLGIANQLMFADGAEQLQAQLEPSERASPLVTSLFPLFPLLRLLKAVKSTVELLPRWACGWMKRGLVRSARFVGGEALKEVVAAVLHASDKPKDLTKIGTEGIIGMGKKTIVEERELVKARDAYREEWRKRVWEEENLDFVICPVMPCPAVRHGEAEGAKFPRGSDGEKGKRGRKGLGFEAPGMTLIWNLLDYSAGVMPITTVDKDVDRLPEEFFESDQFERMGNVAKAVWRVYGCVGEDIRRERWEGDRGSFEGMHGLPVGIQIVGKRWEEEKVLEGMNVVNEALRVWNSKAAT
ncbi:hypothetical protein ONZ45_g13818 [Pleurotus djamor]|nr:hypothetical protein ONZ45_g13818 [Pleurotus djamor]